MHPNLENWIAAMAVEPPSRIALRNLYFDIKRRRIPKDVLRSFVQFVEQHWRPDSGSPELLISDFAEATDPKPYCYGKPRPQPTDRYSRVMEAQTFWSCHVLKRRRGGTIEDRVSDDDLYLLEAHGITEPRPSEMRTKRPFAWITKTVEIERLRSEADFATLVRDELGLLSFIRMQRLVEIIYPPEVSASLHLAAPTFLEGTPEPVYQSKKGRDNWGRAVSLRGGKGLPEAVHAPVPFSSSFVLRRIGQPTTVPHVDYKALAGDQGFVPDLIAELDRQTQPRAGRRKRTA